MRRNHSPLAIGLALAAVLARTAPAQDDDAAQEEDDATLRFESTIEVVGELPAEPT